MKKLIIIPILFLLICGCGHYRGSVDLENAYFEDIYFTKLYSDASGPFVRDETQIYKDGERKTIVYTNGEACGIGCGNFYYFELPNPNFLSPYDPVPEKLWVFQDIDRKCLLYSYTREEFKELKNKAGFSITEPGAVFLLEKTGIRVISKEKYYKLEPTLQPHRYDQALCRPEPDWSKYSDRYFKMRNREAPPLNPLEKLWQFIAGSIIVGCMVTAPWLIAQ